MQKHNKYLVWTIWIATIAFIGAGFVGWGSYDFGSKAGNVAKVGNIEIKQSRLNMVYSNLYNRYNEMFQGQFDEKKAKEMGLIQQAFAQVATQAKLLNYAADMGVIVSDDELAKALESIKGFQKDGKFDRSVYNMYLKTQRLKAKEFEETLREELTITKLLGLLEVPALPLEEEAVGAAMSTADKIKYRVLSPDDVNLTVDDAKLKAFWKAHKEQFKTPKTYTVEIIWTPSAQTEVSDEEIKAFYDTNSFNYTDATGKQLSLDQAREKVIQDLKLKKTKKTAQKAYIAFKKGKRESSETKTLPLGDNTLSKELWDEIQQKESGEILKPKVVKDRYATVKIVTVTQPKVMNFEQAKPMVTTLYEAQARKEALLSLAETTLGQIEDLNATESDFMSLDNFDNLETLNSQESLQFLQKLFTSSKEKGIISVSNKVVVYAIIAQKHLPLDKEQTALIKKTVNTIKQRVFESNLIKRLDAKYPTEVYMGGLTN
ncbi:MAG: peptidylprolyl isomerase [Sulfurovum sp.]|nr:peptidylprolyl isomerase [Sulfurovum sp.]